MTTQHSSAVRQSDGLLSDPTDQACFLQDSKGVKSLSDGSFIFQACQGSVASAYSYSSLIQQSRIISCKVLKVWELM